MKKTIKMVISAFMAIACTQTPAIYAADSEAPGYFGVTDMNMFNELEKVDTGDMLGTVYVSYHDKGSSNKQGGVWEKNGIKIYYIKPKENHLIFVLRNGLDPNESLPDVLDVLVAYYPGVKTSWNTKYNFTQSDGMQIFENVDTGEFSVYDSRDLSDKDQTANAIMHDLASNGLISKFYRWGQTASYTSPEGNLLYYPNCCRTTDGLVPINIEKLKQYLQENHPGCDVVLNDDISFEELDDRTPVYHVTIPDTMKAKEEFMLAVDLYQKFGIVGCLYPMDSSNTNYMVGQNALEQPGDTNLDCNLDILDVIAANKYILGISKLDKTGEKNADMNRNGTVDSEDSLEILKAVLNDSAR